MPLRIEPKSDSLDIRRASEAAVTPAVPVQEPRLDPARAEQAVGASFFQQRWPIALTFGTFALVVLPLVYLRVVPNDATWLPALVLAEAVGLGTSHFFLTLAVYLDPRQRAFFASTPVRKLIYFLLPASILLGMAFIEAWPLRAALPGFAVWFYLALRFADFFHVGRQSVGMLQIWKRPLGGSLPAAMRRAENAFFVGMALLQLETYRIGGHFDPKRSYMLAAAALLGLLAIAIVVMYLRALLEAPGQRLGALALGYFLIQASCAATAVYATWLYLTVLAVHYIEYHVIMAPRCFGRDVAGASRGVSGFFVRHPVVFYVLLTGIVLAFEARNYATPSSLPSTLVVRVFDGIFLLHYVLDAFLWKFGHPHYRATLAPLYFQPADRTPSAAPRRPRLAWGAAMLLGLGLVLGPLRQPLMAAGGSIKRSLLDPLEAQEHTRWGVELAQQDDLAGARRHLARAVELAPYDQRLAAWLRMVEQAAAQRQGQARPH